MEQVFIDRRENLRLNSGEAVCEAKQRCIDDRLG
jgi:hypothetical protein